MLFALLSEELFQVKATYLPATTVPGEMLRQVQELNPDIICVCSLPPSAVSKARYSLKRIHHDLQTIQVIVGLWHSNAGLAKAKERLESIAAGQGKLLIATSLREGLSHVEKSQLSKVPASTTPA